ncbi:hypothetical protein Elgi_32380 [Paenibacillus elgii]|nr:hypothetical protein Elgi_32380 [Paenibacillus elgii]
MLDAAGERRFLSAKHAAPLFRLVANGRFEQPSSALYDENARKLVMFFNGSGIVVEVEVGLKGRYVTF